MSNTIIQIKRSLTTNTPNTLAPGELAYSYPAKTLYIGDANNNIIPITDQLTANIARQAYNQANAAYAEANAAYSAANVAYNAANTAAVYANGTLVYSNAYLNFQNSATVLVSALANTPNSFANISFTVTPVAANAAYTQANAARSQANAAYLQANNAYAKANAPLTVREVYVSNGYTTNNTTQVNTLQFDSDSGMAVVDEGNNTVTIQLNSTFKNWEVNGTPGLVAFGLDTVNFVTDNVISVVANNNASPKSMTFTAPIVPVIYDVANSAYNQANAAYDAANAASSNSNTSFAAVNAAITNLNAAVTSINTNMGYANSAIGRVNTALGLINTNAGYANSAITNLNAAVSSINTNVGYVNTALNLINVNSNFVNTAMSSINSGFSTLNTNITNVNSNALAAYAQANSAYDTANTKLPIVGGTITGSLNVNNSLLVSGNLTVLGAVTNVSSNVTTILDPYITLGYTIYSNNDAVDRGIKFDYYDTQNRFGFFGWDNSYNEFTGFVHATENNGIFGGNRINAHFYNVTTDFAVTAGYLNVLNYGFIPTLNSSVVNSDIFVTSSGLNVTDQANNAYAQANLAYTAANTAQTYANNLSTSVNNTFSVVNTNIGYANSAITNLNAAVSTINTNVGCANSAITNLNAAVGAINTNIGYANSALATVNGNIGYANSAITNLNSAASTINTNIGYANSAITNLNSAVSSINTNIGYVNGAFSLVNSALSTTNTSITNLNAAVATINTNIGAANSSIANLNAAVSTINTNMSAANNAIASLNSAVSTSNTNIANAYDQANAAYSQANAAYNDSNTRVLKAGDTMTGVLNVTANIITNTIFINKKTGLSVPSTANQVGERVRLYDFNNPGQPNYAIGVEQNHIWTATDDNTGATGFKWYGNTTQVAILKSNGYFITSNTIETPSIRATGTGTAIDAGSGNILTNEVTGTIFNFLAGANTISVDAAGASANYTFSLPANSGIAGQVLITDGSGVTSFSSDVYTHANTIYDQANSAYDQANAAYAQANTMLPIAGGTITGNLNVSNDVTVSGNLYVLGTTTNVNTATLFVDSNTIYLAANQLSPIVNAYVTVDRGPSQQNVSLVWNEQTQKWGYIEVNGLFVSFDGIYDQANLAYDAANSAQTYANNLSTSVNTTFSTINTNIGYANSAINNLNAAAGSINTNIGYANSAITNLNSAAGIINTNIDYANNAISNLNAAVSTINTNVDSANTAIFNLNAAAATINTSIGYANNAIGNINSALGLINTNSGYVNTAFGLTNSAFSQTNTAFGLTNAAFSTVNTSIGYANSAIADINSGLSVVNTNIGYANSAIVNLNAAVGTINTNVGYANSAIGNINSALGLINTNIGYVNTAFGTTNSTFGTVNTNITNVNNNALAAYAQANSAYGQANIAANIANTKVYTFTQTTPPVTANANDQWVNSNSGIMYVNTDGATPVWVEFGPLGSPLIGQADWNQANTGYGDYIKNKPPMVVDANGNILISANVVPNNSYTFGTPDQPWQNMYVGHHSLTIMPDAGTNGNPVILDNESNILSIKSGGFRVYSTNNFVTLSVDPNIGQTYFRVPTPPVGNSVVSISSNPSANIIPLVSTVTGGALHITGPNVGPTLFTMDNFDSGSPTSSGNAIVLRRFRGTVDAPAAVQANDRLGSIAAAGYGDGSPYTSTGLPPNAQDSMIFRASENHTTSAQGANVEFWAVPNGTNTAVQIITLNPSGNTPGIKLNEANSGITFADGSFQNTAPTPTNTIYAAANSAANTVAVYANGTLVLSNSTINFNNTATVNVSATANGTTQSNLEFSVNVSSLKMAFVGSSYYGSNVAYSNGTVYIIPPGTQTNGAYKANVDGNSSYYVQQTGTYSIDYSLQFESNDNLPSDIYIWLRINGQNVANTSSIFSIAAKAGGGTATRLIATSPILFAANANDAIQIASAVIGSNKVSMNSYPAIVSPAIPAVPAVINYIQQVG